MRASVLILLVNGLAARAADVSHACEETPGDSQSSDCSARPEKMTAALLQVKHQTSVSAHQQRAAPDSGETNNVTGMEPFILQMIRPDPWNCNLLNKNDYRLRTCELSPGDASLNPHTLECSNGKCSIEHANAFRTLQAIGSLPCCPTPPVCAAPACKAEPAQAVPTTCTKVPVQENLAYLKKPDAWSAYHGWGGSFELDTLKLIDLLGCHDSPDCPAHAFDLVIDIGANVGYFTEKMTLRNFGKNYILMEASPGNSALLTSNFMNDTWKDTWFSKQVTLKSGDGDNKAPDFEIVNHALSNSTGGTINLCETEASMSVSGCNVPIATVDSILPSKLTPAFQNHLSEAQSTFIKVDTEGMDELVLRGMQGLLQEERGKHEDGSPNHLVNFLYFEFCPYLIKKARDRDGFAEYNIKTTTKFLESIGFETFLIGPRFLPLSHGSWDDEYIKFTDDPHNNANKVILPGISQDVPSFTADVFAIRASHPRATEMKVALGACEESKSFDINDPQYAGSD